MKTTVPHLCHDAGGPFGDQKIGSIYTSSCSVNPVRFNCLQVQIHRREHRTAFIHAGLVHGEGEILPALVRQVGPDLQDPVGVTVMWEAQSREHLADHIEGCEQAGDAQHRH